MVKCEYCDKETKRRTTYYFMVIEPMEMMKIKDHEKYVDENHHRIKVCPECEKELFVERELMPLHSGAGFLPSSRKTSGKKTSGKKT